MKKALIIGNWKMYITSTSEAKKFVSELKKKNRTLKHADVWIAPSYIYLFMVGDMLKKSSIRVGAQAVSAYTQGGHTAEVSAAMLTSTNTSFVLIGHSDRRAKGETNAIVHDQLLRAIEAKLTTVLCIGETVRDQADEYFEVITQQLHTALEEFPKQAIKKLIVAYEPVWAIGKASKDALNPQAVHEMQIFIRKVLTALVGRQSANTIPILYGGSVEPENAQALIAESGIAGFLVGHASVNLNQFCDIIAACKK